MTQRDLFMDGFTADDFGEANTAWSDEAWDVISIGKAPQMAEIANEILFKALSESPMARGHFHDGMKFCDSNRCEPSPTHKVRVVAIEEIK